MSRSRRDRRPGPAGPRPPSGGGVIPDVIPDVKPESLTLLADVIRVIPMVSMLFGYIAESIESVQEAV